jgi:hypothetical protein
MEVSRAQRNEYIAEITRELAKMAQDDGSTFLAYLLDLAALEADEQSELAKSRRTLAPCP